MSGEKKQIIVKALIICLAAAGVTVAALTPFYYESQSLYYKFGLDKVLLQWGKTAGMVALCLLGFQLVFVSRFFFLEGLFSLKRLFSVHRTCGILISLLVVIHPLLILGADGFSFFPLERRYWPEFAGLFTMILILGIALVSVYRDKLKIGIKPWKRMHRLATPLAVGLAFAHAGFVSETFDFNIPRAGLALAAGSVLVLFARIYIKRVFRR
jgi:predicted ferric reductase